MSFAWVTMNNESDDEQGDKPPIKPNNRRPSSIWSHFEKLSPTQGKCKKCSACISIANGSYGNLWRHLKRHGDLSALQKTATRIHPHSKAKQVREHFTKAGIKAVCNICSQTLSFHQANLGRHLRNKHPSVKILESSLKTRKAIPSKDSYASDMEQEETAAEITKGEMEPVDDHIASDDPLAAPSGRKSSVIWYHFQQLPNKYVKCVHCGRVFKYHTSTNLCRHLKSKHFIKINFSDNTEEKKYRLAVKEEMSFTGDNHLSALKNEPKLESEEIPIHSAEKVVKKPFLMSNHAHINKQLIKVVANGLLPIRSVSHDSFKKLIELVSRTPNYRLPNKKGVINTSTSLYEQTLASVKEKLQEASSVCLSIECFQTVDGHTFVSITSHHINNATESCTYLLQCLSYNNFPSTETLKADVTAFLSEWNLAEKVEAFVTNDEDIAKMVCSENWNLISCFFSNMNYCLLECLKEVSHLVERVRELVRFFKSNPSAASVVEEIQQQLEKPYNKFTLDKPEQWHTTYEMLLNCYNIREALSSALTFLQDDLILSEEEWLVICQILAALKAVYNIVNDIKDHTYAPLSKVIPYSYLILQVPKQIIKNEEICEEVKKLQTKLETVLETKMADFDVLSLYAEATLLDPRFKGLTFKSKELLDSAVEHLKSCLFQECNDFDWNGQAELNEDEDECWKEFDEKIKSLQLDPKKLIDEELKRYLNESLLKRKEDPLKWWNERRSIYPHLYVYAMKRFCLVANATPADRYFTKHGLKYIQGRAMIKPKYMPMYVFLQENIK